MNGASSGSLQRRATVRVAATGMFHPPRPHLIPPDFCVGEWLVQPGLVRLSRGGVCVRLRPQLMDVLVCLAEHVGKTVSKDEVFAAVWSGQFVTESALARCIAELRQTLGDDAHRPRFIETIPKRGYRLLMPVTPASPVLPRHEEPVPVADAPGVKPEDRAATSAAIAPPAAAREPAQAGRERRRWPWLVGVGCAGVIVASLLTLRGPLVPAHSEPGTLIVSVENATGDAAFDTMLGLALAIQFEHSPRLRVLSPEGLRDLLTQAGEDPDRPITRSAAHRVCGPAGAPAIVVGSIAMMGRNYVMGLEAFACETGETLARRQAEVTSKEQVLHEVERLTSLVRSELLSGMSASARLAQQERPTL